MSRYQKAYYQVFVFSVLISFSPLKSVAYVTPLLALAWFIIITRSSTVIRNVIIWMGVWGIMIGWRFLFNPSFVLHNAFLFMITYGTFAFIITIPSRWLANPALLYRMIRLAGWVVLLEAVVGIVQAGYGFINTGSFDRSNGDYVEGTIHLNLQPSLSFSNPMFATNMAFLLIALVAFFLLRKKGALPVIIGAVALVLASVMHVLIFLFAAFVIAFFIYNKVRLPKKITTLIVATGLLFVIVISVFLLRNNFKTARGIYTQLISGQFPRSRVIAQVINDMPGEYPLMPLIGLGPGQFSSRAALIGTGLYFGGPRNPRPLPLLPQGMSEPLKEYLLDEWIRALTDPFTSSSKQPLFSWLSVYSELGILGVSLVFVSAGVILFRMKKRAISYPQRIMATAVGTGVLFLLFLGIQENYWEIPQAIFVGSMLMKAFYANIGNADQFSAIVGVKPQLSDRQIQRSVA